MDEYAANVDPIVVVRAEGARLFDADGRRYLDANSSWWVASLGHNHPRLVAALERQARENCHSALAGMTHAPAAELAEALLRASRPADLEHVFFSDDGSTAVEVALKLARPVLGAERAAAAHALRRARRRLPRRDDRRDRDRRRRAVPPPVRRRARRVLPRAVARRSRRSRWSARSTRSPTCCAASRTRSRASCSSRSCRAPPACGSTTPRTCAPRASSATATTCSWSPTRSSPATAAPVRCGRAQHAGVAPDLLCTAKGFSGGMLPMAATLATPTRLRRLPRRSRARLLLRALVLRQSARRGGRARGAARLRGRARARTRARRRRRASPTRSRSSARCPASRARARSA